MVGGGDGRDGETQREGSGRGRERRMGDTERWQREADSTSEDRDRGERLPGISEHLKVTQPHETHDTQGTGAPRDPRQAPQLA
eukprot:CAMPEP_0173426814 /NCGR_PEP_ID=MMETSP1357-20121228/6184_1 /TAXON_ID=77926 /ORGANISM="Hemiselmis rufescens, Strain PCC563" /LENGTH=82 /DNA_ID=CAMNT_0014390537 /DNA_START=278 /DNA_END=523 /DNA_ORIENTATION=-